MSGNLESLVRPFQIDTTQPSVYYTPGQLTAQVIVLQFGRNGGGGKTLGGANSGSLSSYCERHEVEKNVED